MNVRNPNKQELKQLADVLYESGHDREMAEGLASSAMVAVCDDYISDCPGYAGKVISVIWSGGPSIFNVFIVEDGKLQEVEPDNVTYHH